MFAHRRLRWGDCAFPGFLIIGAQRAGTTSLFHYLSQHPQLVPAIVKEVHFFDQGSDPETRRRSKEAWYRAHFPFRSELDRGQQAFEATPSYLFDPFAAKRIARLLPDAKLVVLLRNPTERALSHYFHEVKKGRETLNLVEALEREESRIGDVGVGARWLRREERFYSYKARGLYAVQLRRYYECFPRSSLFVAASEELFAAPGEFFGRLFDFLNVDPTFQIPDVEPRNVGASKARVGRDVYDYLDRYFEEPNRQLFELLGKELSWY